MRFCISMDKNELIELRAEIERTESSVLMNFFSKLIATAKKQAEKQKESSEEILSIDDYTM